MGKSKFSRENKFTSSFSSLYFNNCFCFCCLSKTMGFKKSLPFVLKLIILHLLLILLSFLQPSTSSGIYGTNVAGSRPIATPSLEVSRVGNEAAWVGTVEESARLVPTGPDPLHHNNNPIRP